VDIVLTKSPRVLRFEDNENGHHEHRVELTYELLVYANS
jgi:hypothetical protein